MSSFVFSYVIYIFLVNPFSPALNLVELLAGIGISALSAWTVFRIFPITLKIMSPRRLLHSIRYIPWFLYKMIKANLEIAVLVLNPKLPIKPAILKGTTSLKNKESQLLLTSSITLTPGTLTIDTEDDEVTIHYVKTDIKKPEDVEKQTLKPFENFIMRMTE